MFEDAENLSSEEERLGAVYSGEQLEAYVSAVRDGVVSLALGRDGFDRLVAEESEPNDEVVERLKTLIKKDGEVSDQVQRARDMVREILTEGVDSMQGIYREAGSVVMLFGSLEFGDPKNMDADVLVLTDSEQISRQHRRFNDIHGVLVDRWQQQKLGLTEVASPHLEYLAMDQLSNPLSRWSNEPERFSYDVEFASVVLGGMVMFNEDADLVEGYREKVVELMRQDPLSCVLINKALESCLAIRLSRQGDH